MVEQRRIIFDLRCRSCGYNLRGLAVGQNCPECSRPAPEGVATLQDLHAKLLERRAKSQPTAEKIPCTVDALLFVYDSFLLAKARAQRSILFGVEPVTVEDICDAFRDLAQYSFYTQDEAIEMLGKWDIHGSEDVGRIMSGLVRLGVLRQSEDSDEGFAGKFMLNTLFADARR